MHQLSVDDFLTRPKPAGEKLHCNFLFLHVSDTLIINSAFVSKTECMKHCLFYDLLKLGHFSKAKIFEWLSANYFRGEIFQTH